MEKHGKTMILRNQILWDFSDLVGFLLSKTDSIHHGNYFHMMFPYMKIPSEWVLRKVGQHL